MLRLSELYTSTQGEGSRVGMLTQFVRFAGCNMRCPGWPCDTPHAIDPAIWRHEAEKLSSEELFHKIVTEANERGGMNICYTGGEPFLQNNTDLKDLTHRLRQIGLTVECFSNGSYHYPNWAINTIQFMMDWKLEGSGEAFTNREERVENAYRLKPHDGIKFVVKDEDDWYEAIEVWNALTEGGCRAEFWVGSAWNQISEADIVEKMMHFKLPWKLNVQVHKYIWDPDRRGV